MVGPAAARPIGRYLLFGEIASGARATVHLGRLSGPAGFARTVAIKALRDPFADDPELVSMFLDEARLVARIHHPNVVPTLDVVHEEDGIFLVMEYVHGESLAKLMQATQTMSTASDVRIVATVMSGVLHGLHAAHEVKDEQGHSLGVVHRDVSPQNVLVGVDGVPRVLDFGVAKALSRQKSRNAQVKGKIAYMAPERVQNRPATRQSDVYAAAVVTWEFLTGQPLFPSNQAAILTAVLQGAIRPPSEVAGHVPPDVDRVVLRGLERDPTKRYQTALEMALDLERCAGIATASEIGEWVESLARDEISKRAALVAEIESASGTQPMQASEEPAPAQAAEVRSGSGIAATLPSASSRGARGRRAVVAGIGAAVGVLVVGAGIVLLSSSGERRDVHAAGTANDPSSPPASAAPFETSSSAASPSPSESAAATPRPPASSSQSAADPRARTPISPRRATPARAVPASCDPPFWIDEQGHKRYKRGCL